MATKDSCLPFKDKQNTGISDTSNGQYRNLNLNKSQHHSSNAFSKLSKIVTIENRKILNYDFVNNSDSQARKDSYSWSKSTKKDLSNFLNNDDCGSGKEDGFKKRKNSSTTNNNTLSLHIAAYENSIKAAAAGSDSFDGKKECLKQSHEKCRLSKKGENAKQNSVRSASMVQNSFEFSRQKENEASELQIGQFKASQRLLNPNEALLNSGQQDLFCNNMDDIKLDRRYDWVGPPDKTSKIRPIRLRRVDNESNEEEAYRKARQDLSEWNSAFWKYHNELFESKKADFVAKKKQSLGRLGQVSAADMSVFYKDFLNERASYLRAYNNEWYKKNFALIKPAIRVNFIRFLRLFKR